MSFPKFGNFQQLFLKKKFIGTNSFLLFFRDSNDIVDIFPQDIKLTYNISSLHINNTHTKNPITTTNKMKYLEILLTIKAQNL